MSKLRFTHYITDNKKTLCGLPLNKIKITFLTERVTCVTCKRRLESKQLHFDFGTVKQDQRNNLFKDILELRKELKNMSIHYLKNGLETLCGTKLKSFVCATTLNKSRVNCNKCRELLNKEESKTCDNCRYGDRKQCPVCLKCYSNNKWELNA